ncbi:hypothetical protein MMC14_005430 [Varicellaria rhodocarpa]|nr:hypothetical protein [Varicellaria rhodocarpa]
MVGWSHILWKFAQSGDTASMQRMFSTGQASPYDISPDGSNALSKAASRGHARLGQFLLDQVSDADFVDAAGRTIPERFWDSIFYQKLNNEDAGIIKGMFNNFDYINTLKYTPLHNIVLGFINKDLKAELSDSTATINSVDALGRTPLCWATIRDDVHAVKILLAFGADPWIPDIFGCTCLHFAMSTRVCYELLNSTVNIDAPIKTTGRTTLNCYRRSYDAVDVIDLLIQAGADSDIDACDELGGTPLLNAIHNRFTSMATRLIDLGANLNVASRFSREIAVHFAVSYDHHEILRLLLQKDAEYNTI